MLSRLLSNIQLPILLAFSALLAACAGSPTPDISEPALAATPEPEVAAVEIPERAFPDESMYPLLVAEFALRRKSYDVALKHYMEQSATLRDSGVSAHTTHLSQYMQREHEALEASSLWVELEPNNAEANHTLATLLIRKGRPVEAVPHMAVAQRQGTAVHFPALLSGIRALDGQQRAQLSQGIDELTAEFPDNIKLLLTQSLLQAELKNYELALDKLDHLFELEPVHMQALVLEAKILLEQKTSKPFAHIEGVLKEEPDNSELRLQYAKLLTRNDIAAAREQFEILSAQSPRDGDLLFSLALINRETGDQEAAAGYLRQVLALGQREDEANYYLGRVSEDDDKPLDAITHYMKVEDSTQFMPANNRIGRILLEKGQGERSTNWFVEQREKNPSRREQLYSLEAELLSVAGEANSALSLLNEALGTYPDASALRYSRAMLLEQRDDLEGVERDLRRILESEPDNTTALNALGYILANRTERYAEALELVTRALALQPNEPAILDSMGWVLFRSGRSEEALEFLTRAYADFPDPEVAAHLGEVLWSHGKTEAAIAVWQGAAIKDPEHKILRDTLDRLGVDISTTIDTAAKSTETDGQAQP